MKSNRLIAAASYIENEKLDPALIRKSMDSQSDAEIDKNYLEIQDGGLKEIESRTLNLLLKNFCISFTCLLLGIILCQYIPMLALVFMVLLGTLAGSEIWKGAREIGELRRRRDKALDIYRAEISRRIHN